MAYKYNEFAVEMGKRIYERRKKVGMTQEQLAEKIGVSVQTISYTEQGIKTLRPENIVKLCRTLDVSTDYILTGETSAKLANTISEKLSGLSGNEMVFIEMILNSCVGLCNLHKNE